jgi:hypothetical protein
MNLRTFTTFTLLLFPAVACGGSTLTGPGGDRDSGSKDGGGGDRESPPDTGRGGGPEVGTCGLVQLLPPIVTVTNAATGAAVCDAVQVGGSNMSSLSPCKEMEGCTGKCSYVANDMQAEGGGTFSVTITAPGFEETTVPNLIVRTCGCGGGCEGSQQVTVTLTPAPDGSVPPTDAGSSPCPASPPSTQDSCTIDQLTCEYGTNPDPYCNSLYECDGAHWMAETGPKCPVPTTECPPTPPTGNCSSLQQICPYTQSTCICTDDPGGLPLQGGPVWSCIPITSGCPSPRPDLGTPCSGAQMDCDYGQCSGGIGLQCKGGYWSQANTACPV